MKNEENKTPYHNEYGLWSNAGFMLKAAWKYNKMIYFLVLLSVLFSPVSKYMWSFVSKFVIDLASGTVVLPVKQILFIAGGICVLLIVTEILEIYTGNDRWWRETFVRIRLMSIKNSLAMKMDFANLENPEVLDCFQKANNSCSGDASGIEALLKELLNFVINLSGLAAGLAIMATLNVWIVVIMVGLTVFQAFISNRINKKAKKEVWDILAPWWRKNGYMSRISTDFSAAKDIRMFSLKNWILDKYRVLNKERLLLQKKNEKLWALVSVLGCFTWLLSETAIYIWLLKRVVDGTMTVGNFSMYLSSAGIFFQSAGKVSFAITTLLARSREADDFRSFLDYAQNEWGASDNEGISVPKYEKYEFVFENVSFKYPKAENYALKNMNITIKGGERLAVVGLNGAGKSTFIKLLLRLYKPTEGRILLNGTDIQAYNRESYFDVFAPLFQEVSIFAFSMGVNVSMKRPDLTDNELAEAALRNAGLSEKLDSLEKGIDTQLLKVIYDDGTDLSGGEKQKLALARALYKQSPVVVLDEPTAALDAIAESRLYQNFDRLIGGKTAVYISHRLSSTQFCNNVAMFKDGEMIEYGTHNSLLEAGGEYAEMWRVQSQYYKEN